MIGRILQRLFQRLFERSARPVEMEPAAGYDLWASTYDDETENLLVALDERMFGGLLAAVDLREKVVADVGCGTGRHWNKILGRGPAGLIGYDPSAGMLTKLRRKYPNAIAHQSGADRLTETSDEGCDVIVSTLALCHVPDLESTFAEWARALRPGGDVLLTDYHPSAAASGHCSFRNAGRLVVVAHHVHPLVAIEAVAERHGLELKRLEETVVDDSMKHRFVSRSMQQVFDRMKGTPLIFGIHLRRRPSSSFGAARLEPRTRP